jgi:PIN domain nuclease of toxin-antitoxin system
MKLLLDAHIFLWAITDDARLSPKYQKLFADEGNDLYLSVVSIWEILIKVGIGKLPVPTPAAAYIARHMDRNRIGVLTIQSGHLAELEGLPPLHKDPFDRMLVAQSRFEKMSILSMDSALRGYDVQIL